MELKELQKHWNSFGKLDPLWAILTDPTKKNNRWEPSEFFRTGVDEISEIMRQVDSLQPGMERNRALDFGCGVGRLTQALCRFFRECHGTDIASSMIAQAELHNRYGDRCLYHLNERDDLSIFESATFDLVYSARVLQHMRPQYSLSYIKEFLRIIAPGGVAVFQLPGAPLPTRAPAALRKGSGDQRLPDSGFRASFSVLNPPCALEAGCPTALRVRIKNESDVSWPALGADEGAPQIRLGNHWIDGAGNTVALDDGRCALPRDLHPGAEVEVDLLITPPLTPGRYILELDMVQEYVAWFKARGAKTTQLDIRVDQHHRTPQDTLPSADDGAYPDDALSEPEVTAPIMESYGVPREQVISFVEQHAGTVLAVQDVNLIGGRLSDHLYFITVTVHGR